MPTDDPAQVFTYIFVGELVLKLWALGPREYAKDRFNLFDAVITTLGFVQLMIESSTASDVRTSCGKSFVLTH